MDSKRDIKNKRWLAYWSQIRKRGFLRFWMIYGAMYFVLIFLSIVVAVQFFKELIPSLILLLSEDVITHLLAALLCGLLISCILWIWNELRYRHLGAKYPNATRLY